VALGGGGGDGSEAFGDTTVAEVTTTAADDGADATTATTSDAGGDTTAAADGAISFPLSWSAAEDQGITDDVAWGDRCDPQTGRLAVPDFFASECFAPFTGDNGGATAPGVTAESIKVVFYRGQEGDPVLQYLADAVQVDDTNAEAFATMNELIRYYETYYELYGRSVELVPFEASGTALDPVAARADAVRIAEEIEPFAVLGGPALTNAFADELAARQIVCIGCTPGQTNEWYVERDPYVFGLGMSGPQGYAHATEFITKRLVGKPAEHGGDAVRDQPRVFGLVYIEASESSTPNADEFVADLAAGGVDVAVSLSYPLDPTTIQETASNVIARLKEAGVTTVILATDGVAPRDFTREATVQQYVPEWFVVGTGSLVDVTAFGRSYDQEQWRHAFGITLLPARVDPEVVGVGTLYEWFTGGPAPAADSIGTFSPPPALFFAVVQGVGPNLTAETFRDAMFTADPTPRAISQPSLSWGDKPIWTGLVDYQGVDDMTAFWWDPDATGPDEIRRDGTGMYRYQEGGRRFMPGEWTADDAAFDPDGAVTLFDAPPPGEEAPDYPSPAGG
jgi:hypothetical protein